MDLFEIASEPVPSAGIVLSCFATMPGGGAQLLELASMRVTKDGLKRPASPLPLDPPSLVAAIRLAEQAEDLVASGLPVTYDQDNIAVLGKANELTLTAHRGGDGQVVAYLLSWVLTGEDDTEPHGGAFVPGDQLPVLGRVLRRARAALNQAGHQVAGGKAVH